MQSKVKLSKRQMKEDKFTTFMLASKDRFQVELEDRWQYYVIGLVLVVVLIWAVAWHFDRQSAREVETVEALSRAMLSYQSGDEQVAILEFSQILENYGGSSVAEQSAFILGNLNLATRNYDEAIRYYRIYLDDYGGNRLNRAATLAGIAAAWEDQGQYLEAAAGFVAAIEELPGGPLEADYQLGAVRNYLAGGNQDQARARMAELEDNHAGTDWARQASRLFAEKQHGQ